jgi:predicted 2-oxoglutarate/Fe(II)-dependent dioxygenase YbiX
MKKNLLDYVKHNKQFLDSKICDSTVNQLNKLKKSYWQDHLFSHPLTRKTEKKSGDQELSFLYSNEVSTKEILMKEIWNSLSNYMNDLKFKWFDGWNGYSELRFNRYLKNTKMAEHCDHIDSLFEGTKRGIPILSVLGMLNDDYKGGEFIMFEDHEIKLKKGDLLIFPSIFLYPHKVEPVKKGIRYSFISWVW